MQHISAKASPHLVYNVGRTVGDREILTSRQVAPRQPRAGALVALARVSGELARAAHLDWPLVHQHAPAVRGRELGGWVMPPERMVRSCSAVSFHEVLPLKWPDLAHVKQCRTGLVGHATHYW